MESNQTRIILISSTTNTPLRLNNETINKIIVYGGVSVSTIIAMTIFMDVLLKRINENNSNHQPVEDKHKIKNTFILDWINSIFRK